MKEGKAEVVRAQCAWYAEKDPVKKEILWKEYWEKFGPEPILKKAKGIL